MTGQLDLAMVAMLLVGFVSATVEHAVPAVVGAVAAAAITGFEDERSGGRSAREHRTEGDTDGVVSERTVREGAAEDAG